MNSISETAWMHPLCRPFPASSNGPFVELADGRLAMVDDGGWRLSADDGESWSAPSPIHPGINTTHFGLFQMLGTRGGSIVIVYLDWSTYDFHWNAETGEPGEGCQLQLWAIRSEDGGKTWVDRQMLLEGYNASFSGFIQTRTGALVATVEHLTRHPGRWVVCSLVSDDDGKNWRRSNWVDLGGHGHHDGALEPTVAELSDGRLLMLIRTNLDRFWQAFSQDGGRYWRSVLPSRIDASAAPGYLLRLRSGRLVLVWNRLQRQGAPVERSEPDQRWEVPASVHREELSIAFSTDDARHWTKPVVIARQRGLCYPYVFERRAGELWIGAMVRSVDPPSPVGFKIEEEEFVKATR